MNYEIVEVAVCRLTLDRIEEERKKFTEEQRWAFRLFVAKKLGINVKKLSKYEIHHIVPISLGGTHAYDNLCMIGKKKHKSLHKYIKRQVENLAEGQRATIEIPVPKAPYVWNLEDFIDDKNIVMQLEDRHSIEPDWMAPLREELSIYAQSGQTASCSPLSARDDSFPFG